jgi:hypothetical protein
MVLYAIVEEALPFEDDDLLAEPRAPTFTTGVWEAAAERLVHGLFTWEHQQRWSADAALIYVSAAAATF